VLPHAKHALIAINDFQAQQTVSNPKHPCADTDMDELPGEWELLKHVRDELEGSKRELKANAHKRLELGAAGKLPPLTAGQVVEQKIFHILIDRPIVKERITTRLQRTFYEREYVRVVSCLLCLSFCSYY